MTILLVTNHKVDDEVYVVDDCVRHGVVKQVNFTQQDVAATPFVLSYDILYDGFTFNTSVTSGVNYNVTAFGGSPLPVGSPPIGSPVVGSPTQNVFGSPLPTSITVEEKTNGGGIYIVKDDALTAFGETLA